MEYKRGLVILILGFAFMFSFGLGIASAASISVSELETGLLSVSISDAVDLYGYEVDLDYTGSITDVSDAEFLGSGGSVTCGYSERGSIVSVYCSRLDNTGTGISGSGALFNISYTGSVSLRYTLFVDESADESYVYYNASAEEEETGDTGDTGSGGGSGGGGGGGAGSVSVPVIPIEDIDVIVVPSDLTIDLVEGMEQKEEVVVINKGDSEIVLEVSSSGLENIVTLPETVRLSAGAERTMGVLFKSNERGLIAGKILFSNGDNVVEEIDVAINVRSENFLFDSSVVIPTQYRTLTPGSNLFAQIDLLQVGPKEKVDVVATYVIKDFSGNTYLEEHETFFVLEDKSYTKEFNTEKLPPGKYILGLEIVYPGAFATSSYQFEVESKGLESVYIVVGILVAVIVIFVFVVRWAVKKNRPRRRR